MPPSQSRRGRRGPKGHVTSCLWKCTAGLHGAFAVSHNVPEGAVVLWTMTTYFGKLDCDAECDADIRACAAQVAQ